MSMPELLHTLESMYKKEQDDKRFLASLQGINLEEEESESNGKTFDQVSAEALGFDTGIDNDVVGLRGSMAAQKGFGINEGLGYSQE